VDQKVESGQALPSHTRISWHAHADPEMFYVLVGQGRAYWQLGGKAWSQALGAARAFYKVGNVRHDMETTGDEPLLGIALKIQASL